MFVFILSCAILDAKIKICLNLIRFKFQLNLNLNYATNILKTKK